MKKTFATEHILGVPVYFMIFYLSECYASKGRGTMVLAN